MSVVIPVYNVEEYVEECLRSVLDQALENIEVIVVDDGSTDGSLAVVHRVAAADDRVRVLTQPNRGQGAARNLGVAHVRAEFLTFVDADDTVPEGALRRQRNVLRKTGSDFTVGNVRRTRHGKRAAPPWWAVIVHRRTRRRITIDDFPEALLDVIACNRVFRTSFWREQVGGFPEGVAYEDHAPMVTAYVRAKSFDVLAPVTYSWRLRENHTSTSQSKHDLQNLRDRLVAKQDAWKVLSTEASQPVIDQWMSRVLDADLSLFIVSALRADDEYRSVLAEATRKYFGEASDAALREVRLHVRLRVWLVAAERWDLLERLLEWQRTIGVNPATVVVGSEVLADESVERLLGIEVPERLRVLGRRETRATILLTGTRWLSGTRLEISGCAAIANVDLRTWGAPAITVTASSADGARHAFAAEPASDIPFSHQQSTPNADYTPGGFRAVIDLDALSSSPGRWTLDFDVALAGVRRVGRAFDFLGGSAASPPALLSSPMGAGEVHPRWFADDGFGLEITAGTDGEPARVDDGPSVTVLDVADAGTAGVGLVVRAHELSASQLESLRLEDARGAFPVASVTARDDGTALVVLPSTTRPFNGPQVAVPTGSYSLVLPSASGDLAAVVADGFTATSPHDVTTSLHQWRIARNAGGALVATAQPPLQAGERGRYHQQRLREWHRDHDAEPEEAVYFQCYRGEVAADSQLAMHRLLRRTRPDLTLYWGVESRGTALPEGAVPLLIDSRAWYDHLARVRYLSNNIDFDRHFAKRSHQRVLATFHGYPFKSMGRTFWEGRLYTPGQIDIEIERRRATWDAIVVPSEACAQMYRKEYDYDGEVLVTGYPRCDALVDADVASTRREVLSRLGISPDKTVVLYAPTYRDSLTTRTFAAKRFDELDLDALASRLGPDHVVLLRGHNNNQRELDRVRDVDGVVDVTDYPDINDLTIAADVAVLDYSSLRFDWAITGKPMVFFVPDLEEYFEGRPPLFPYEDTTPGPLTTTLEETVDALLALDGLRRDYAPALRDFNAAFNSLHDGHATERVVEAFFTR